MRALVDGHGTGLPHGVIFGSSLRRASCSEEREAAHKSSAPLDRAGGRGASCRPSRPAKQPRRGRQPSSERRKRRTASLCGETPHPHQGASPANPPLRRAFGPGSPRVLSPLGVLHDTEPLSYLPGSRAYRLVVSTLRAPDGAGARGIRRPLQPRLAPQHGWLPGEGTDQQHVPRYGSLVNAEGRVDERSVNGVDHSTLSVETSCRR